MDNQDFGMFAITTVRLPKDDVVELLLDLERRLEEVGTATIGG